MFQLRRILLSGLVALLMVGMVTAGELSGSHDGETPDRSYIGSSGKEGCTDSKDWQCIHLEFFIDIDIPW